MQLNHIIILAQKDSKCVSSGKLLQLTCASYINMLLESPATFKKKKKQIIREMSVFAFQTCYSTCDHSELSDDPLGVVPTPMLGSLVLGHVSINELINSLLSVVMLWPS